MGTRQEMRAAKKYAEKQANHYICHFLGLLHNSIVVDGLPESLPKRYFLGVLFRRGKIGLYGDEEDGLYLPAHGIGVNVYGLPTQYTLVGFNGKVFTKRAEEIKILRINDLELPILPYLRMQAEKLVSFDTAIAQNLEATRTQTVAKCTDQATLLSLQNAWDARRTGALCAFVADNSPLGDAFTVYNTGAEYLVNDLLEARSKVFQETLQHIGIATDVNKSERVQATEIGTANLLALVNVQTIIDTFNYDAEVAGLKMRMRMNEKLDRLYESQVIDDGQTGEDEEEGETDNADD